MYANQIVQSNDLKQQLSFIFGEDNKYYKI